MRDGDIRNMTDVCPYELCIVQYHVEQFQPESIEPVGFVFAASFCDVKLMTSIWN
jgi:hypothetical protein